MRSIALHLCCSLPDARRAQGGSGVDEKMSRPAFRQVPSDQEVNEGQTVRLEFTLSGRPTPEIEWYLGEARLKQDANHKVRRVLSATRFPLYEYHVLVAVFPTSSMRASWLCCRWW